jgi:sirohydrochlorin cobaltochelatase
MVMTVFGTSSPDGQKNLEDVDRLVLSRYPGADVRWAFTSDFILKKLRESGRGSMFSRKVAIKTLSEVYDDLKREGKTDVLVQPLLVAVGSEYSDALDSDVNGLNVSYGYPLLAPPQNVARVAQALAPRFGGEGIATLLCCHGNKQQPACNAPYILLDRYVRKNFKNVFAATLEGPPGTEEAFADIKKSGCRAVKFVPLLIVAGGHIANDVVGEKPHAYKNQIGLPATAEEGIGSNPAVMDIMLESIDWALGGLGQGA